MNKHLHSLSIIATCLSLLLFALNGNAQHTSITYNLFKSTLKADTFGGKTWGPDLIQDGPGGFVTDNIPAIFPHTAMSFGFNQGTGLKFDNASANSFLQQSYSIEVYYKFASNVGYKRLLDFQNFTGADTGFYEYSNLYDYYPLPNSNSASNFTVDNVYDHLILTRDSASTLLKGYHNGQEVLHVFDANQSATIHNGSVLEFFKDDGQENSAGNVAFIVLYNYTLTPQQVLGRYHSFSALGVNDVEDINERWTAFPNPSNGKITINLNDIHLIGAQLKISNILGETIMEQHMQSAQQQVDLTGLLKGMYFITLSTSNKSISKKLIIE